MEATTSITNDTTLIADLETLFQAVNRFFGSFAPMDWGRKHGKDWIFSDVPYHLTVFNRLVTEALTRGTNATPGEELDSVEDLNDWNEAQFAQRPSNQTGSQSLAQMRRSQQTLLETVKQINDLDAKLWLPILEVRGWRTARLALEFSCWHTWLHFSEAQLRDNGMLPDIPASIMYRCVDFNMDVTASIINAKKASHTHFVMLLELAGAGGGAWSFIVENGDTRIVRERVEHANMEIVTDIATFMKVSAFDMQNPVLAALTGKIKMRGVNKVTKLQRLFTFTEDQVWSPMKRGAA